METNIYDTHNRPRIYLADDGDQSFYTWDGHAVACLAGEHVFGWKGRHIGWFVEGILYDDKGFRIGFTSATCPADTYTEPAKYTKFSKLERFRQQTPHRRPALSLTNSNQDIDDFIRQDAP